MSVDYCAAVVLDWQRDPLGTPEVKVCWRWSERDEGNLNRLRVFLAEKLRHSNLGACTLRGE